MSASETWLNYGWRVLSHNDAGHLRNLAAHRRIVLRHDVIHPFTQTTYVVDVTEADYMTPHRTDQLCVTARSLQVRWR
jgi:hypothetical protein